MPVVRHRNHIAKVTLINNDKDEILFNSKHPECGTDRKHEIR